MFFLQMQKEKSKHHLLQKAYKNPQRGPRALAGLTQVTDGALQTCPAPAQHCLHQQDHQTSVTVYNFKEIVHTQTSIKKLVMLLVGKNSNFQHHSTIKLQKITKSTNGTHRLQNDPHIVTALMKYSLGICLSKGCF